MTKIYLTRHGETVDNASQTMQGQTQGQLNATGRHQARQLALELKGVEFDAVVSSDLWRAVETAEILAEGRGLSVVTTPLLRERDWGDFTGRYIPSLKGLPFPDNVETLDALLARAGCLLDWLRANYAGRTVLAVGHGIINKAIQAVHYGKKMREVERMTNCEVRILDL